ncbi:MULTISPECIES: alpha/beta hydrolase family protein [Metabacillus]|uniref:Acyl-peptide hydrolase n=2 Tax=Metabacillus TaxID=2675233 RepID=A0A179T503_9BACI|nr:MULTISPECIES: alpha/beta fold hydrolase [Metabacillus]OAS89196.1 peptidase S9 [Metabacillus litoralis]QNF28710.1 S9 family peptidase [Metabacillus sp. KUDC1714]
MTKDAKDTSVKKYSIDHFFNTESIISNSISFDEKKVLYSSDKSRIYNAYMVSLEDNSQQQVTYSTDNAVYAVSFFPKDNRFLFLSDKGGNEILHIYVQNENGEAIDLTPGENERAVFFDWSKDEKSFFYGSNKRNPSFIDVYEMNIETYESTCIFTNNAGYEFGSISPDKRFISLAKVSNLNDSDIYLYDLEFDRLSHLTAHEGDVNYFPQNFSEDSDSLYFLTDENYEFKYLKKYHFDTNQSVEVAKENWDITTIFFSSDYHYLVYSINIDAKTEFKIINLTTHQQIELPSLPEGQIVNIQLSKSEELITFLLNSSNAPSNLYAYYLESKELKKLSDTLNPEIDPKELVVAKVIRYPSFDGLEIPAIYYKPVVNAGEKAPALVFVHGGPGGQSSTEYYPLFQYLANQGYAILDVNYRGSSGYGKSFFSAADLKQGEIDLEDCIQAKNFLREQDYINGERIGIIGDSYGGFMVLAALAFRPEEFKVGVDIFGVSNWERTLKSIPSWWESYRDALYKKLGNPFTQTEYLRSISPLFHAEKINKPLIVLQGANDPRVLQVESDEIVAALKKNNVPVEYVVFPDEGHGFMKMENKINGYKAVLEFLDEHLKA